jgi:hypothetical protein
MWTLNKDIFSAHNSSHLETLLQNGGKTDLSRVDVYNGTL